MDFDVCGPFELTRHGANRLITDQSQKDLKVVLEDHKSGLSDAIGCYIFAIRAGKGARPWYVGQACKRSLLNEALNSSNREKYNKAIAEQKGTPIIFLLPMQTPGGKFRKRKGTDGGLEAVDFLERWLIMTCIERNPGLINNKLTRLMRRLHIVGIFNAEHGEATYGASLLRKTLWT